MGTDYAGEEQSEVEAARTKNDSEDLTHSARKKRSNRLQHDRSTNTPTGISQGTPINGNLQAC